MNSHLPDTTELYRLITFEQLLDCMVNRRFTFIKYKLFDDPWEGFYHKGLHQINEYDSYAVLGEDRSFIMCFTKRKNSDAMWRIYSKNGRGVQIITNVGRLRKLVAGRRSDFDCHLKSVCYSNDLEKEDFFVKNFPNASIQEKALECLFHKREAFDHEEEVRLALYSHKDRPDSDLQYLYSDPNNVIETVILDPRIDKRTEDLQKMTIQKLGFKGIVKKSALYTYKRVWYETKSG